MLKINGEIINSGICYKWFKTLSDLNPTKLKTTSFPPDSPPELFPNGPVADLQKCHYKIGKWQAANDFYPNSYIFAHAQKPLGRYSNEVWRCEFKDGIILNDFLDIPENEEDIQEFWNGECEIDISLGEGFAICRGTLLVKHIRPIEKC